MYFRRAVTNDADELFDLVRNFATSFETERILFDECFKNLISDKSALLIVAEENDKLIGYCLGFEHYAFYANGRVSWLEEIMVKEEFRKKGIGRKLIEAFETWSKARDSKLIGLATRRAALI